MIQRKAKVYRGQIQAIALCFIAFVLLVPAIASGDYDLDAVWRDLDAVERYYEKGNYAGYFVVQGDKEENAFFSDSGLIISRERKNRKKNSQAQNNRNNLFGALQYTKGLEGKRVTVYYDENLLGHLNAVKIVVHE